MQQTNRDRRFIDVILKDIDTLNQRVKHYAVTEDSFKKDFSFEEVAAFDLVMTPVHRIAEDALHPSDELMNEYLDYPWDDIRGFRNFVAHGYRNVDRDIA